MGRFRVPFHVRGAARQLAAVLLLVGGSAITACQGDPVGDAAVPAVVEVVSGDHQSGIAGTALETPLVVKVTDSKGRPVQDVEVTFSVGSGAVINSGKSNTDSQGLARAYYILGRNTGQQVISATVPGIRMPATFTLTATPGGAGN
jgi:hypothetical protein